MGRIIVKENFIYASYGINVICHNISTEETSCIELPEIEIQDSTRRISTVQPSNQSDEESTKNVSAIAALQVSMKGDVLGCITQDKRLIAWRISNWKVILNKVLRKRPMALSITPDSEYILVADKTGDVYKYSLCEESQNNSETDSCIEKYSDCLTSKPILGHLSMLLDMIMTSDGKYVITCDRDEKIRVSRFPNCYNIQSFCLGHEEFVSQILEVPSDLSLIVSGSGDGTARLFDIKSGNLVFNLNIKAIPIVCDEIDRILSSNSKNTVEESDKDEDEIFIGAVTKLAIVSENEESSILALSLHRLPMLVLVRVTSKSLECISTINLECIPEEFYFLSQNEIVVLKQTDPSHSSDENPIIILNVFQKEDKTQINIVASHNILEFGQKHAEQLRESGTPSMDIKLMQKHQFDNMGEYLKLKEERMVEMETGIKRRKH